MNPHEAGVVCPLVLYGVKTVPPTRVERRHKMTIRRQHHTSGTGPNQCRTQRRHLKRNPRPIVQQRTLFHAPRRRKQLRDWAFPHNDENVISFPIDLTTDDDTTSADNVSVTELLREEVEQEVEQQTEWENDDTNDKLSRDSSPPISTSLLKARKKSATAFTHRSRPSETPIDGKQVFVISKMLTQNAHSLQ